MRRALVPALCLIGLGAAAPAFAQENRECGGLRDAIRYTEEEAAKLRATGFSHASLAYWRDRYADLNRKVAWMKAHPEHKRDDEGFTLAQLEAGRKEVLGNLNSQLYRAQQIDDLDSQAAERRARGRALRCNGMDGSVRPAPPWARSGAPGANPARDGPKRPGAQPPGGGAKPWERGSGGTPSPMSSGAAKPWARGPAAPQTPPPPRPNEIQLDMLGSVWTESENGWSGQWVRRGKTNTFDATWTNGWTVKATLTITISGTRVSVYRVNASDNNSCNYEGTLNGMNVSGTYRCTSGGGSWSATIR